MVCVCVVRLELDRAFVFARGSGQIDFAKEEHFSKCRVRFGQIWIEAESFEGRLFRLRRHLEPVRASVKGGQNIGARETRVSQRIIWIARDRLLIERDRFWNVVARTLFLKRWVEVREMTFKSATLASRVRISSCTPPAK